MKVLLQRYTNFLYSSQENNPIKKCLKYSERTKKLIVTVVLHSTLRILLPESVIGRTVVEMEECSSLQDLVNKISITGEVAI